MADELTVDFRDQFQFGDVVRTCAKIDGKVLFGAVTVLGGLERCFDEFVYRRMVAGMESFPIRRFDCFVLKNGGQPERAVRRIICCGCVAYMPKANAPIESYTTLAIPNNSTPAVQSARLKRVPRSLRKVGTGCSPGVMNMALTTSR